MPYAAGLALVEASKVLEAMPWDPQYKPPRGGDVPSEEQARAESPTEVTEAMVAGLSDEVLDAWIAAGTPEAEARDLVQGILRKPTLDGQWNSLQTQLTKARERIAQLEAVRA